MLLLLALLLVASARPEPCLCDTWAQLANAQDNPTYVLATECARSIDWRAYTTPYAPAALPFAIKPAAPLQVIAAEYLAVGEYAFLLHTCECGRLRPYWINYTRRFYNGVTIPSHFVLFPPVPRLCHLYPYASEGVQILYNWQLDE